MERVIYMKTHKTKVQVAKTPILLNITAIKLITHSILMDVKVLS